MPQLIFIALATFASEDLACIGAGVLIAQQRIAFLPGVAACALGIFAGDLLLYFAGRLIGRPLVSWRVLRGLLSEEKLERASAWLTARGARVVIASRFTPGLRLPTYVAAGILRTRFCSFAAYFLLAAMVWTPLLVGATVLLGEAALRTALAHKANGLLAFAVLFGGAVAMQAVPRRVRPWHARRRLVGWVRRKTRWEFWPVWAAYLPLLPYLLYLAVRYRSLTLFTAANPGIPSGGLMGESKSAILAQLSAVAPWTLVRAAWAVEERIAAGLAFASEFPVVLKPDVGERGRGVAIVRNGWELEAYLRAATRDTIVQRYVPGVEFGIFYYRVPGMAEGRILSITEKRFPEVVGDGQSTIEELILRDDRAVCLADTYLARCRRSATDVPSAGERVSLVDIGSHCRGAIFLDGRRFETRALAHAVDRVAKTHSGFWFGRFDVRSASPDDLQAGRFQVLELNGVSAEPTHIYDPSVTLREAYAAMCAQWRLAFAIGLRNQTAGFEPMSLLQLLVHSVRSVR
jgi:membrane protein DedA with SNARE-associated domain